jgi:hypothetical protein
VALAHVVCSLRMKIKPVSGIPSFSTSLMKQSRLWRDYQNTISWEPGAKIDILAKARSHQVFIETEIPNHIGAETH